MSFVSNLKTMLGGFALAQLIPLLAVPIFTRLYTPEAFGFQSLFMGSVAVLTVVCTLRLDLALLLADDEEEEGRLVGLIAATLAGVLVVVAIAIAVFGDVLAARLGEPGSQAWMWLLLPMVAATAFVQVATSLLARQKRFGPIARTNVLNQVGYVAFASSGGSLLGSQGLVVAKLVGQLVGALLMVRNVAHPLRLYARMPSREQTYHLWHRFHQFVIFNTPYSLIGTVARDMPIYVFSAMAASSAAGFYGLARTVLSVPMLFTAAALSQVFYREAVEFRGTPRIEAITGALLGLTMRGTAPLFAFICIWGDVVFGTLFGAGWVEAGLYAMILAPAAWLGVQTGWPERLFEAAGRQDVSFKIQMGFDVLTAIVVIVPMALGASPIVAVAGFATINCLYHVVYLSAIFTVSDFSMKRLRRFLFEGMATLLVSCLIFALARLMPVPALIAAFACALVASAAAAMLSLKGIRNIMALTAPEEKEK